MTDPDLADRILAALTDAERFDRRPVVRSAQLLAQLVAAAPEPDGLDTSASCAAPPLKHDAAAVA